MEEVAPPAETPLSQPHYCQPTGRQKMPQMTPLSQSLMAVFSPTSPDHPARAPQAVRWTIPGLWRVADQKTLDSPVRIRRPWVPQLLVEQPLYQDPQRKFGHDLQVE